MSWDLFCPKCGATIDGSMSDDENKMREWQSKIEGKMFHCSLCDVFFTVINGDCFILDDQYLSKKIHLMLKMTKKLEDIEEVLKDVKELLLCI